LAPDLNLVNGGADGLAVHLAGLGKRFPGAATPVFSGINLAIKPGEAVAIIGANGTGKSTLLRSLNALTPIDEGRITVLGEPVNGAQAGRLRALRARIGFVFQKHFLVSRLCALSNVIHGSQSRSGGIRSWTQWLATAQARSEALACLAKVDLADRAMQRVDSLSGGQSQRVAIARMLMQKPELVLADEPAASLDPKAGMEIMELLFNLSREAGRTLVFVSHDMEHAIRFSDRIIGLAEGKVSLDIPASAARVSELTAFFTPKDEKREAAAATRSISGMAAA
jgi:phosphonate transport system ATP-binding protein